MSQVPTTERPLRQIECNPPCGFLVRSQDADELVALMGAHVERSHGARMGVSEIRRMMVMV